jgi:DNA processing protein
LYEAPAVAAPPPAPAAPPPSLTELERKVWDALTQPRHADDLTRELGIPTGELVRTLTTMELKRLVRKMHGNSYVRRDP